MHTPVTEFPFRVRVHEALAAALEQAAIAAATDGGNGRHASVDESHVPRQMPLSVALPAVNEQVAFSAFWSQAATEGGGAGGVGTHARVVPTVSQVPVKA